MDGGAAKRVLLSVALIDTVNLVSRAKQVTEPDILAAHTLQQFAPMPPPALFARLDDAKFDRAFWHSLTAAQALRYDYKAFGIFFGTFGLSSVLFSFSVLVKEDFLEEMHQRSSKVAVYDIMTFMRGDRASCDGSWRSFLRTRRAPHVLTISSSLGTHHFSSFICWTC